MKDLPIIQGRGLNTDGAIRMRLEHLKKLGIDFSTLSQHHLDVEQLKNNIESFVGSVEVPLGIVGPLMFRDNHKDELVYCAAGTNEGALVASMNRGARAISLSGGFEAFVLHQKMVRSPLFIFEKLADAIVFKNWTLNKAVKIKEIAERYSNHAELNDIQAFVIGKSVQLKFVYSTGDASGQNMTTTCTWHAMLWMIEEFQRDSNLLIRNYVIEGNGSSDKKPSHYSGLFGRGIHVVAECFIKESVLQKVLRISSAEILRFYTVSMSLSKIDGMVGYNINVANAIAAIFVATGQDLGSLHESSVGILNVEPYDEGLYLSLNLPSLVVGTVGGGTHLSKQKEALDVMGCFGSGKVERFAKLIAGFSLALEISTYAAIVSNGFAKAHEKLGRNKPTQWLLKSEINQSFVQKYFSEENEEIRVVNIDADKKTSIDNGILSTITGKISKKLIGFVTTNVTYTKHGEHRNKRILLKSKATDLDVIKGLHFLAANIDTMLADLINEYKSKLEYWSSHKKEIYLYEYLQKNEFRITPKFYGKVVNKEREIYLFAMQVLDLKKMRIIESENKPELWDNTSIKQVIDSISEVHLHFNSKENRKKLPDISEFKVWEATPLYKRFIDLLLKEEEDDARKALFEELLTELPNFKNQKQELEIPYTIIHNDFNSRNIAVRNDEQIYIYDWELAVINIPHRDIVEFLSFVLPTSFSESTFKDYLEYHYSIHKNHFPNLNIIKWNKGYAYALKEYIICRLSFYEVAGILAKYEFSKRVLDNAFRMLKMLRKEN